MAFSHDSGFDDSITASQPDSSWLLERCDTWAREQALATEMDVSTPFYEVDEDFQHLYKSRGERRQKNLNKNKGRAGCSRYRHSRNLWGPPTRASHCRYQHEADIALRMIDPTTKRSLAATGKPERPCDLRVHGFKTTMALVADNVVEDRVLSLNQRLTCASCHEATDAVSKTQAKKYGSQARCAPCILKQILASRTASAKTRVSRGGRCKAENDNVGSAKRQAAAWIAAAKSQSLAFTKRAGNAVKGYSHSNKQVPLPCFAKLYQERLQHWANMVYKHDAPTKPSGWSDAQIRRAAKRGHKLKGTGPDDDNSMPAIAFTYHGTHSAAVLNIDNEGLKVPGTDGVSVRNGSSYGVGIYSAREVYTAWSYARASGQVYACAVLVNVPEVKVSGGFVVASDARYVLPLCRFDCKVD